MWGKGICRLVGGIFSTFGRREANNNNISKESSLSSAQQAKS